MTFISLEFNFGNTIPRLFTAPNHGFHKQRSSTEGCCDELGPGKAWESAGHEAGGWGRGAVVTSVFCYCTGLFVSQMTILTTLVLQLTQGIANQGAASVAQLT